MHHHVQVVRMKLTCPRSFSEPTIMENYWRAIVGSLLLLQYLQSTKVETLLKGTIYHVVEGLQSAVYVVPRHNILLSTMLQIMPQGRDKS